MKKHMFKQPIVCLAMYVNTHFAWTLFQFKERDEKYSTCKGMFNSAFIPLVIVCYLNFFVIMNIWIVCWSWHIRDYELRMALSTPDCKSFLSLIWNNKPKNCFLVYVFILSM